MAIWQDPQGGLHDDMEGAALTLATWPANQGVVMTQLTDAEVATARAPTFAQVQAMQIATLQADYDAAVNGPVSFKNAAGVTSTYPSGNTVLANGMTAQQMISTILSAGSAAWTLGKWLDTNNVAQTFTFADLQGLASAMESVGSADWTELVAKIADVQAITESTPNAIVAVQAITW